MAANNVHGNIELGCGNIVSSTRGNENHMVLSVTYALNNSDTKRMQVGLRMLDGAFKPVIKLSGNSSAGIYFDRDTWEKFQENMELMTAYLRGAIKDTPNPVIVNDTVISFTTAYGVRAIMLNHQRKKEEENRTSDSDIPAPTKKRRIYYPSIVLQKASFDGIENITKCINARYNQLDSLVTLVGDCARFLIAEIELHLPKRTVDENIIKQTLATKTDDIEQNVRRQVQNLQFLDGYFEIIFHELTSIHLYEIIKTIVMNASK